MRGMATVHAHPGRLRPSFFLPLALVAVHSGAAAEGAVYRCGQTYTNRPAPQQACERLTGSAVTVVPAPRSGPALPMPAATPANPDPAQRARDEQALQILQTELAQAQQRWTQLQAQGPGDAAHSAALARQQRDIESLQREIARRGGRP